jgi:hypothetical protein
MIKGSFNVRIMKKMFFIILFMHISMNTNVLFSQNFKELPERVRDSLLIKIADRALEKYGPEYNRGYLTPVVKNEGEFEIGILKGEVYYTVTYPYDKSMELMEEDFSARVVILENTGKAIAIVFGNRYSYNLIKLEQLEKEGKKTQVMPFTTIKKPVGPPLF